MMKLVSWSSPQARPFLLLTTLLLSQSGWAAGLEEYPLLKAGTGTSKAKKGTVYQIEIPDLSPTQLRYGPREVQERAKKFAEKSSKKKAEYIIKKTKKVVIGPGGKIYLVDGHHLARFLHSAKYPVILAEVISVETDLSEEEFFARRVKENQVYLWDVLNEREISYQDLPKTIADLKKDPYRDLPWALQELGDIDEPSRPFAEFEWSRLLFRKHFSPEQVEKDWGNVLKKARDLSHGEEAKALSKQGLLDGYRKACRELLDVG